MRAMLLVVMFLAVFTASAFPAGFDSKGVMVNKNTTLFNYSGCNGGGTKSVVLVEGRPLYDPVSKTMFQLPTPDPLLNFTIADNYSHNVSTVTAGGIAWSWVNLLFNGTSGCIVRLMNSTTKALYPAMTVAP